MFGCICMHGRKCAIVKIRIARAVKIGLIILHVGAAPTPARVVIVSSLSAAARNLWVKRECAVKGQAGR